MGFYAKRTKIEAPAADVFKWHMRQSAFKDLVPPWQDVEIIRPVNEMAVGQELHMKIRKFGFEKEWIAQITKVVPEREFVDIQKRGPFRYWRHCHRFIPIDEKSSYLEDEVHFEPPFDWLIGWWVKRELRRLLDYRHKVVQKAFLI